MTFREWFDEAGDAGEPPTLVSLALFAVVFLPSIFLVGMSGGMVDWLQDAVAGLSNEMKVVGITVVVLGAMAIARIVSLLLRAGQDEPR